MNEDICKNAIDYRGFPYDSRVDIPWMEAWNPRLACFARWQRSAN